MQWSGLQRSKTTQLPEERVGVFQSGRQIGSVPANFDPRTTPSKSVLYVLRDGEFARGAEGWIATASLGPGDLEAIAGFKRL
jgi:hypothetical protein